MAEGSRLLTLMRHGRAAAPTGGLDDHARPLEASGRRDVRAVAGGTAVRAEPPEILLHSDARRTLETAELVRETLGLPSAAMVSDARLYLASVETLLEVLGEQDARGVHHLMIVGHNPGLEALARRLDARGPAALATSALCRYARGGDAPHGLPGGAVARLLLEIRP